jgi:hypothetical protein
MKKNIKLARTGEITDLQFVEWILDMQIQNLKSKPIEKKLLKFGQELQAAEESGDEKKVKGLEKKIEKLSGRAERRAQRKKKVRVKKKDLQEVIDQEISRVLDA